MLVQPEEGLLGDLLGVGPVAKEPVGEVETAPA